MMSANLLRLSQLPSHVSHRCPLAPKQMLLEDKDSQINDDCSTHSAMTGEKILFCCDNEEPCQAVDSIASDPSRALLLCYQPAQGHHCGSLDIVAGSNAEIDLIIR